MLLTIYLVNQNCLLSSVTQFYLLLKNVGLDIYNLPPSIILIPILVLSAKRIINEAGRRAGRAKPRNTTRPRKPQQSAKKPEKPDDSKTQSPTPNNSNHETKWDVQVPVGQIATAITVGYLGGKAIDKEYTTEADGIRFKPSAPAPKEPNSCDIL